MTERSILTPEEVRILLRGIPEDAPPRPGVAAPEAPGERIRRPRPLQALERRETAAAKGLRRFFPGRPG